MDLVKLDDLLALPTSPQDKSVFGSQYLPRLQLCGASSDPVKEGKIGVGRFAFIVNQEVVDLGPEIHILIYNWRPKAVDYANKTSSYDVSSQAFAEIREKAKFNDSKCNFGPEFLCYHAQQGFCAFFFGSSTLRKEATTIVKGLESRVHNFTIKSKLCSNGTHKWHGLLATKCSFELQQPDMEELTTQLVQFRDIPKEVVETRTV